MQLSDSELQEPPWISIRRVFSGVPKHRRDKRIVIVLQAFADDSGSDNGSEVYALTGYLLPSHTWDDFSVAWEATCRAPRGIQYYKTNEAIALKRQFAGWTHAQRDKKLIQLANVIAEFRPIEIGATIRRSLFESALSESNFTDQFMSDPYYLLATYLCARTDVLALRFQNNSGLKVDKVDFFLTIMARLAITSNSTSTRILSNTWTLPVNVSMSMTKTSCRFRQQT